MGLGSLLAGTKVLEKRKSPYNGELTVVKDIAWGTHIKGGGLTQSGGVAEKVWRTSLNHAKKLSPKAKNVLILGLGGGSIAQISRELWPKSQITGVDIDNIIVDLGRKYMDLDQWDVKIIIQDAEKFLDKTNDKYDVICIDMYRQTDVPGKFDTEDFIQSITKILSSVGLVVVNRLYYNEKRVLADKFFEKLKKHFVKIDIIRPEANIMYLCRN